MIERPLNKRKLGEKQEQQAVNFLVKKNFKIIDRNWHWSNKGEIDIVAIDPKRFGKEYYVFIEVKYRSMSMSMSLYALNPKKIEQLQTLAQVYLLQKGINPNSVNISFDFIAIHQNQIEHIENFLSL
ncbi:MAG: YraN family protein [Candidatus Caenarcaniphilales bacterium]|jgi:putative endonuclease|nr:YraN family protein [Candidatus Caenarcaniphilales bacterium]